jgi:hypothetical protein
VFGRALLPLLGRDRSGFEWTGRTGLVVIAMVCVAVGGFGLRFEGEMLRFLGGCRKVMGQGLLESWW